MRSEAHIRSLDNCIAAIVHYSELNGRSHPKPLQHTTLPAGSGRARGRMAPARAAHRAAARRVPRRARLLLRFLQNLRQRELEPGSVGIAGLEFAIQPRELVAGAADLPSAS